MTDDFDPRLRDRLDRLAAAVPTAATDPNLGLLTQRRAVRGRVQFGSLATVMLLLIVVAGSGLLGDGRGGGGGREAVGSATDGVFTLMIRSPRDHYQPRETIDVAATLEYVRDGSIVVSTAADVVGFGVEQIGGLHRVDPVSAQSCRQSSFEHGQPEAYPFSKSGGFSPEMPDAEFIRAYLNISGNKPDPALRLPAGTWSIFAITDLAEGDCGGTVRHQLKAAITVTVDESSVASESPPASLDTAVPSSAPSRESDRTFPGVCPAIVPSLNQCAAFAAWAVGQSGVNLGQVQRIEMTQDQCPGAPACSTGVAGYVVGVRIVTDGGTSSDQLVDCTRIPGSLGGINFLCDEIVTIPGGPVGYPSMRSPISGGYHDVPCLTPAPQGPCATALPTIEPSALSASRPLTISSVEIPIDHVGAYSINLGEATLPNGILTAASAEVTSAPTDPLVSYDGYDLVIMSLDGGPPFENYYAHGWRPGVEHVRVTLNFTVLLFQPGAVINVAAVDVH
ncbi:MAG: hypothetical protein ABI573_11975 [Chloroflexota bacterium]